MSDANEFQEWFEAHGFHLNEDGEWTRRVGHLPMYVLKEKLGDDETWDCTFNPAPGGLSQEHPKFAVQEALMHMIDKIADEGAKANNKVKAIYEMLDAI